MLNEIVIVGGGHGGAQLCASLRQCGFLGSITLVSQESCIPYHRPPLSKAFLRDQTVETQIIKPQAFYDDNNIKLVLGKTVVRIDRKNHQVELDDQSILSYSKLVLSTGANARKLNIPGAEADGIYQLKIAEDARLLREKLANARTIGVIGGGFVGLEAAATFAALGNKVTVFEAAERLLGRAVSPEISEWFLQKHRASGMEIILNANVSEITTSGGQVSAVICDNQTTALDMVLIGIGVDANCQLAEFAGVDCENGIIVDDNMQSSDPDILAIGDCVCFEHWQTGARVRLESVQNANDQARNAALTLTGQPMSYHEVAWFWSDQGKDKLQIVGLSNNADQRVVRSEPENNRITVYHFCQSQLVAIDTVNNPAEHMIGRRLLAAKISPTPEQMKQPDFKLRGLLNS